MNNLSIDKLFRLNGKTFSLQNENAESDNFYADIGMLADKLTEIYGSEKNALSSIRQLDSKRRFLKILSSGSLSTHKLYPVYKTISEKLKPYTAPTNTHLKSLSFKQKFERTLTTTEQQYHLYMVEFELVNRINKNDFKIADTKLAFLPHCLHDLGKNCLAETDGIDYVCRRCSKKCFIRKATELLSEHNIKAYVWRTANLRTLFKKLKMENETLGVLGVACVPELVSGMKMCTKAGIPVVGIPLDANRCMRWMGNLHPTAVNLSALEKLVS